MVGCTTFLDIASFIHCANASTFNDGTIFAIAGMIIIAFFAYKARLSPTVSLVFAWALTYAFYLIFGSSSPWLEFIFAILTLGIGIRIVSGFISYFRQ